MHKTFLLIFIVSCIFLKFGLAQTIELNGKQLTFGAQDKAPFWTDEGQIESEYSYIKIYESDVVNGAFYKNQLVTLYLGAYDNNPYPVSKDVENLLQNLSPYKEYTEFDGIGIDFQLYKTSDFYISRASSRMNTNYIIAPIDILNKIQNQHPEYLKKFTE